MELEKHQARERGDINLSEFRGRFEDIFSDSEISILLLTLMREKPASDVELFPRRESQLEEVIEKATSLGLNCYVERDPGETMAESFSNLYEGDSWAEGMLEEYEFSARLFLTQRDYEKEFFRPLVENDYGPDFHRRYGEFLEFDPENVEAFVYKNLSLWRKLIYRLRNEKPPESLLPREAMERFRPDASTEEKRTFVSFTFQRIAGTEENFEKAFERAERRREAVKESRIDLGFFMDKADLLGVE